MMRDKGIEILEGIGLEMKKKPSEDKLQSRTEKIMGYSVEISWDDFDNELVDDAFIRRNIVQPIVKNWKKILKLAESDYNKYIYDWKAFKDKEEFLKEIQPNHLYLLSHSDTKKYTGFDLCISSDRFFELMGGHELDVYFDDRGNVDNELRLNG